MGPTSSSFSAKTRAALHAVATAAVDPWIYDQVLYVAGSASGADGSPYAGVGDYVQVIFTPRDMFGNVAASVMTQSLLGPPQPQNTSPLRVSYSDAVLGLGSWPSVGVDYRFRIGEQGSPALALALEFAFAFDPGPYKPTASVIDSGDPNDLPAWQQHVLADLRTYRAIGR